MEHHLVLCTFRVLPIALALGDDLKSDSIGLFQSRVRVMTEPVGFDGSMQVIATEEIEVYTHLHRCIYSIKVFRVKCQCIPL